MLTRDSQNWCGVSCQVDPKLEIEHSKNKSHQQSRFNLTNISCRSYIKVIDVTERMY